ncbi:MAG: TetR family transcriptional regulator [Lentisphaerae bacterium]|nr:TetR family transcriptional regulator [Lentisphaerota bacterium]
MARRTKADAAQTRTRIIRVAITLFHDKGYFKTTFSEIAGRIGLTKGAVYWHFTGKPDLLLAMIAYMEATRVADLGRQLPEPPTFEALKHHMVAWAEAVVRNTEARKFFNVMSHMDWSAPQLAPVRERFDTLESGPLFAIRHTLASLHEAGELRPDVDVGVATAVLWGLWTGLLRAALNRCLAVDLAVVLEQGFSAVSDGLRAERGKGR